MLKNKKAYYQGTEEPTPGKKQYKSDKAILNQPRFEEPLYKNYDLYEVPGVDGKAKHGPGTGLYQNLDKYKSVKDFIDKKRKRNKDKYKADDSWIENDGSITKNNKKAQLRMILLKLAIDFPIDDQIGSDPILGNSESYSNPIQLGPASDRQDIYPQSVDPGDSESYSNSTQIGGLLDKYLPQNDFEGKSPDQLDFGRDYTEDDMSNKELDLDKLSKKYLTPAEPSIYGLPDGINPKEDLDAPSNENPWYGTTDSGNTLYQDKWNI